MEKLRIIIEKGENNFSAYSEQVLGCVATGETLDEVKNNIIEAIEFHKEGLIEDNEELPNVLEGNYEVVFDINIELVFSKIKDIIKRTALAEYTGINKTLLGHYASGIKQPKEEQAIKILKGIKDIANDLNQFRI